MALLKIEDLDTILQKIRQKAELVLSLEESRSRASGTVRDHFQKVLEYEMWYMNRLMDKFKDEIIKGLTVLSNSELVHGTVNPTFPDPTWPE